MVKWLRHRPFTAASRVRIPYASPFDYTGMYLSPIYWALSSAGRASALQAEGQRFDPVNSHHKNNSVMIMVPWCSGYHVALSRRRSRVRFPSGPYDSLAQLVEQLTFNQWVTGSSPVRVIILCGFGGIGRRTRFRIWRLTAWGFKSLNPH